MSTPDWVVFVRDALMRAQRWQWDESTDGYFARFRSKAALGLPYCLHETNRPQLRCVVNRRYRHVGAGRSADWSDYNANGWLVPHDLFQCMYAWGFVDEHGYFFNDGNPPWRSPECFDEYKAKIEALLALSAQSE